jgi:hypothetical protein
MTLSDRADLHSHAEQIVKFVDHTLEQPMRHLLLTDQQVSELVKNRAAKLEGFGKRVSGDLRQVFLGAAKITRQIEGSLLKQFSIRAREGVSLARYSSADLYVLSGAYLDREATKRGQGVEPNRLNAEVTAAIVEATSRPDFDGSFSRIIEASFAGRGPDELTAAKLAAVSVVGMRNAIAAARDLAQFAALNGVICRGMFCRVILEAQGSTHASAERRQYLRDKAGDAFLETLAMLIPVVGEFATKCKLAIEAAIKMLREEAILDDAGDQLGQHQAIAETFIIGYQLAINTWVDWATKVNESLISSFDKELPKYGLFPETPAAGHAP